MSAASLKLPVLGMGVLLVAGVAAWVVFSGEDDATPGMVAPLAGSTAAPEQPVFKGVGGDDHAVAAEALAPTPAAFAPAAGAESAAKLAAGKLADRAPRETAELTGRIVDAGGRPVEAANVSFHGNAMLVMMRRGGAPAGSPALPADPEATTGRDGRFKLQAELPEKSASDFPFPGSVPQLATRHDLFATLLTPLPQLAAGAHDLGDLVMDPGAWITGRVVDSNQRPQAGASVRARNDGGSGGGPGGQRGRRNQGGPGGGLFSGVAESLGSVTTTADGRFTVRGLHEGKASLTVQKTGLRLAARDELQLTPHLPLDVGDVVLEDGALISGVVVDEDGAPIAGAAVSVSSMARIMVNRLEDLPRQQIGQEFGQLVNTDSTGHFEVAGLAGGTYTVHVSAPGHEELSRDDVPAGTKNLTLAPVRLGSLLVSLVDSADGHPLEHARLKATQAEGDGPGAMWRGGNPDLTVLEGADAIKAAGLNEPPAGAYLVQDAGLDGTHLVVAADGYATQEVDAPAVSSAALGRFTVRLVPAAVVAGRVLDAAQQPVAGALLQLVVDAPADDGGMSFSGGRAEMRRTLRIGSDPAAEEELSAQRLTARTGADGTFEIRGASAGDWTLRASADGFVTSPRQKLTLAEGESQRDLAVVLDKAGTLAGIVTEADGTPVSDIEVSVTPASAPVASDAGASPEERATRRIGRMFGRNRNEDERRARTQTDGTYAIDGLKAGDYIARLGGGPRRGMNMGPAVVFAMDGGGGEENGPSAPAHIVAAQETRVDFVRPKRASLSGRVIAAGSPVPGVAVSMRQSGGMPFGGERATTDERGEFSFADVEAGSYDVSATAPGAALERKQTVKLEAGREQHVDLQFAGSRLSGKVVDGQTGAGVAGVELTVSPVKDSSASGGDSEPRAVMSFAFVTAGGPGGGAPGGMNMTINGGGTSATRTDAQGNFELKYVEPGRYTLEAQGAGYMKTTGDAVDVAENQDKSDLKLTVNRGGIVEGQVRSGSTGQALDKVPVRLGADGDEKMNVTEAGGHFRFDGLAPGDYTVEALGSGFQSDAIASKTVKVKAGETASVDLTTKG